MGAEGDTTTDVFGFARDAELTPRGTRSEDDLSGGELFAEVRLHQLRLTIDDGFDAAVVEEIDMIDLRMLAQVSSELRTRRGADGGDVFDTRSLVHLTTDALSDDGDMETLTGGVDSRSDTRGTATDDDEVVATADRLSGDGLSADLLFESGEEVTEGSLTDMYGRVASVDGGDRADVAGVHFILEECAVDHLVLEAFVVECHDVQRLDDFGAVGAAERSVGREAQRRLQRSDTADEDLFGEVLALPISVEDGEDERGELVTARDSAEGDARSLPITEDAEAKDISGTYLDGELGAGAGEVACHRGELFALGVACVVDDEGILVLQVREETLKLSDDILIELHKSKSNE